MESNDFYQSDEQYIQDTFLDENGRPISPRKARHLLVGFTVICFAAALALMIILFYIVRSHGKMYDRCSVEVVGVVVDNVRNGSSENSVVFPVFRAAVSHVVDYNTDDLCTAPVIHLPV